jgi:hypothetical protein
MTDKVRQNKERFDRKVEDARSHLDLSTQAKRRYLSEAYAQAKAEHVRLCVEHKESRRSIADLERKVFEVNMPLSVSPTRRRPSTCPTATPTTGPSGSPPRSNSRSGQRPSRASSSVPQEAAIPSRPPPSTTSLSSAVSSAWLTSTT